jgi:hypothetical protein
VGEPADPPDGALDPEAESRVGHGAVLADVEVPLERLQRETVLLDPPQQQVVIVDPLAAADDLAVALRRDHVDAEGPIRSHRIGLHVEGFHGRGIAVDHDRPVVPVAEEGLVGRTQVVAGGERRRARLLRRRHRLRRCEDLAGVVVGDPGEGGRHRLEHGGVPLESLQLLGATVEHPRHDRRHQVLREHHDVVEIGESHLGLHHPELGEVTPRLRLLGAEGRPEAVDLPQGHAGGLEIELARLGEIGLAVEVVRLEECGGSLAGRRREDRAVDADEAVVVEEVADRLDDLVAHAQRGHLPLGAQPEVAVVEEEFGPVLLRLDGVLRGGVEHLQASQPELVAARRSFLLPHGAGDRHRGLESQVQEALEGGLVHVLRRPHALAVPGAVADHQEGDLPLVAVVVRPAAQGDRLAHVPGEARDLHGDGAQGAYPSACFDAECSSESFCWIWAGTGA